MSLWQIVHRRSPGEKSMPLQDRLDSGTSATSSMNWRYLEIDLCPKTQTQHVQDGIPFMNKGPFYPL
jgi:hypothetical protein